MGDALCPVCNRSIAGAPRATYCRDHHRWRPLRPAHFPDTVHLHGAHSEPKMDGLPDATFPVGDAFTYTYGNDQDATGLWYHDHAWGLTRLQVTAGLAGVVIVGTVVATGLDGNGSDSGSVPSFKSMQGTFDSTGGGSASSSSGDSSASAVVPMNGAAESAVAPEPASPGGASPDSVILSNRDQSTGKYAYGANQRAVAHKTDIVLGTTPENVQDVSNEISSVVDDHDGIVLDSNVSDGPEGIAGASFRLLIPTNELDSAVGDLSAVADLRSRSQEATDITAPTLTVEDRLQTSRAKVKSLVNELAATTTEEDRLAVEAELSAERDRVANLTTTLNRLERRASLTPVRVDVQTGEDFSSQSDDGSWGPADAIDDIGGHLGTAAGVALIGLAIAIPIALISLLIALVNRLWVKTARRRVIESEDH